MGFLEKPYYPDAHLKSSRVPALLWERRAFIPIATSGRCAAHGTDVDLFSPMSVMMTLAYTKVTLELPPPRTWIRGFGKSKVQPPPLEGPLDIPRSPKSTPPPLEGPLDLATSPKSNPPPRGGFGGSIPSESR